MDADRIAADTPWLSDAARPSGVARLRRVLTAYALWDCEVGYCQGLTDLAVPFLELYHHDDEAFAAFCGLMARVRRNFLAGMQDMHRQLQVLGETLDRVDRRLHRHLVKIGAGSYVFAFQMLLLLLRREVSWPDVFTLWECMWASEALLGCAPQQGREEERGSRLGALLPRNAQLVPGSRGSVRGGSASCGGASPTPAPHVSVALGCRSLSYTVPEGSAAAVAHSAGPAQVHKQPSPLGSGNPAAARPDLRVYVVAAALHAQRRALMACRSLEEVIQFTNRFPQPRDVIGLVHEAERIYRACHQDGPGRRGSSAKGKPLRFLYSCLRPESHMRAAVGPAHP